MNNQIMDNSSDGVSFTSLVKRSKDIRRKKLEKVLRWAELEQQSLDFGFCLTLESVKEKYELEDELFL